MTSPTVFEALAALEFVQGFIPGLIVRCVPDLGRDWRYDASCSVIYVNDAEPNEFVRLVMDGLTVVMGSALGDGVPPDMPEAFDELAERRAQRLG